MIHLYACTYFPFTPTYILCIHTYLHLCTYIITSYIHTSLSCAHILLMEDTNYTLLSCDSCVTEVYMYVCTYVHYFVCVCTYVQVYVDTYVLYVLCACTYVCTVILCTNVCCMHAVAYTFQLHRIYSIHTQHFNVLQFLLSLCVMGTAVDGFSSF